MRSSIALSIAVSFSTFTAATGQFGIRRLAIGLNTGIRGERNQMKMNRLGTSDIDVSEICLGTMTWGSRHSEAQAHDQMDYALDHGVNFIDTAEMYPVLPIARETSGASESIIGTWLRKRGGRDRVVIATKIVGDGSNSIRDGGPIGPKSIRAAVEMSLKRLQTDYIDLYQLHWPNRGSYHFRQSWKFDPSDQDAEQIRGNICETLETLDEFVAAGKIRTIGLSNESCWGTSQFLQIARERNFPRVVSMQNEYNLLDRKFDLDFAELSHNEKVGLLAFSPLATGLLSGKYQGGATPAASRREFSPTLGGRYTDEVLPAVDEYIRIADEHGLDRCQMALSFCLTRPFMASVIIGATTMEQLKVCVSAADVRLGDEVLDRIAAAHRAYPNPMG